MSNFVSYSNATELMTAIGNKFRALAGAYTPKGSTTFALLPATLTSSMLGNVYNVSDAFTTDNRFVEGTGKAYPAGTNVVVVDADTTGSSPDYKFDCLAGFVDLSGINAAIQNLSDSIMQEFSASANYDAGDMCMYQDKLYQFTASHTSGDPWNPSNVTAVSVVRLINALSSDLSDLSTSVDNVEAEIAPEFDSDNAYTVGSIVTHNDHLYKFTSAHTAGDPWDATEVTSTTVTSLITAAEPDQLTAQQIADLEALL